MRVKLFILEVEKSDFDALPSSSQWTLPLGSRPRNEGEVTEGLTVPQGKVWLFPSGSDFEKLEKQLTFKGKRIVQAVNID